MWGRSLPGHDTIPEAQKPRKTQPDTGAMGTGTLWEQGHCSIGDTLGTGTPWDRDTMAEGGQQQQWILCCHQSLTGLCWRGQPLPLGTAEPGTPRGAEGPRELEQPAPIPPMFLGCTTWDSCFPKNKNPLQAEAPKEISHPQKNPSWWPQGLGGTQPSSSRASQVTPSGATGN